MKRIFSSSYNFFSSDSTHIQYKNVNIVNCRQNPLVIDIVVWISTVERYMSVDFQFGLNVSRNQIVTRYKIKSIFFLYSLSFKFNARALIFHSIASLRKLLQILVSLKILFTPLFKAMHFACYIFLLVKVSHAEQIQHTPSMYDDVLRA